MISALPDIKLITLTPEDEFMIIACDGIWNFMTSEEVIEFVRERLKANPAKLSSICEEVVKISMGVSPLIINLFNFCFYFSCSQIVWQRTQWAMAQVVII